MAGWVVGVTVTSEGCWEWGGVVLELTSFIHSNVIGHFPVMAPSLARCKGREINLKGWDRPANK